MLLVQQERTTRSYLAEHYQAFDTHMLPILKPEPHKLLPDTKSCMALENKEGRSTKVLNFTIL